MTWNVSMKTASFAGIDFEVTSLDDSVTKRVVEYKYPWRDGANLEDLGREPRVTRIEALFFNGPNDSVDFEIRLADLIEMADLGATDLFVHPTLGEWEAKIRSLSIRQEHSSRDNVSVSIEIVEDGVDVPLALVEADSVENAQDSLNGYANDITDATLGFTEDMSTILEAVDAITDFADDVNDLSNDLTRQVNFVRRKIDKGVASVQTISDINKWPLVKPMKQAADTVNRLAERVKKKKPRVVKQDIKAAMPLILLAHRIYGDGEDLDERVAELLAINVIRNPYLIDPGLELEVHGS